MTISGYLSIYNDWDMLAPALRQVRPYIDELVVVDGGYAWMAAFLEQIGRNPARSEPPVHRIIEQSGIPTRIIAGVWRTEIQKRLAGYSACTGDYVLRLDADELLFFDRPALTRFFQSGAAVAEMEVLTYIAPGWCEGDDDCPPRAGLLFDRRQISAEQHLQYLWLVLTADALPVAEKLPVASEAVAFNAHLTNWRTPRTAIQRACFYVLNWNRKFGVPWIEELRGKPLDDVASLLKFVPAPALFEIMLGHPLVAGYCDLAGKSLRPTPLTAEQQNHLTPLYRQHHEGQRQLNRKLRERARCFARGQSIFIDITGEPSFAEIVRDGNAAFQISEPVAAARAELRTTLARPPWNETRSLACEIDANIIRVAIPDNPQAAPQVLRRAIELRVWPASEVNLAAMVSR